jgi:DsbC/DsbD-like thiol-disulfide interchange protein
MFSSGHLLELLPMSFCLLRSSSGGRLSLRRLVLLGFALCLSMAQAQTGLKIQLVPEDTAVVPGRSFRVGLFIQHEPGWHTYWRQPGIVGVPTTMTWDLPSGFKVGPLEYPEPEATKMFHIKAQGYERDVLLQTLITPPRHLSPGSEITLSGKAAWMCCGTTCHPGSMKLEIKLPVAESAQPHPRWATRFAQERAAYAQPSDAWQAEAIENGMKVVLTLRPIHPEARSFSQGLPPQVVFFTEDGWINSDQDQHVSLNPDGSLTIQLVRAEIFLGGNPPKRLHGIVQRKNGWHVDQSLRSMAIQPLLRR